MLQAVVGGKYLRSTPRFSIQETRSSWQVVALESELLVFCRPGRYQFHCDWFISYHPEIKPTNFCSFHRLHIANWFVCLCPVEVAQETSCQVKAID